jgi:NAD(P)-dependent dehydrogenase (short-subunit alcohol dehydrogenase family)
MTDLRGGAALVTGSRRGIGKATAVGLGARAPHVLVVGRVEQRAKAKLDGLPTQTQTETARDSQ